MASGLLGKGSPSAGVYTPIYTVSAGKTATANIRVINRDSVNAITHRLAVCPPGYTAPAAPADADWIVPLDVTVSGGGMTEDTAVVMSPGEVLVVFCSAPTVTFRAHGFEE